MANKTQTIAELLGARFVAEIPDTGGGAFGAARLLAIVSELQQRMRPGRGKRPGRPTDASWVRHPKVPMSSATQRRLVRLAKKVSTGGRRISPMQLAATILEDVVSKLPED